MTAIKEAAAEFLGHKRVAVTGVSRSPENHCSNVVYKRLREGGYEVFAISTSGCTAAPAPAASPRPRPRTGGSAASP